MNNKLLINKNIFISGSYGNLGKIIAEGCAAQSSNLILNGKNIDKLKVQKKNLIEKYKIKIELAQFDISNEIKVKNYFSTYKDKINVLINNAHSSKMGSIDKINKKDFLETLNSNLIGTTNLVKFSLNSLKKNNSESSSSIINISSIYGVVSPYLDIYDKNNTNSFSYGASKAALNQITKYFAIYYSKFNIRVNSLILGPFPSKEFIKKNKSLSNKIKEKIPLKRFGNDNDLIGPIIFLSSDYSSFVTGSNIFVDGGWTAW